MRPAQRPRNAPRVRAIGAGLLAATLLALAPSGALADSTPTPQTAIQMLNAWRAELGMTQTVTEDPVQTEGCRAHTEYYRLNPTSYGHFEDPTLPGFSDAGHQAAASSVLSYSPSLHSQGPLAWQWYPYHRSGLLNPRLTTTGYWAEHGISCMGIIGRTNRPISTFRSYPYPVDGQTGVPTGFRCDEFPSPCLSVPGNDGTVATGVIPSVHFAGPFDNEYVKSVSAASMTPDGGQPATLTVESGGNPILDGGLNLIPYRPLLGDTWYTARVEGTVLAFSGSTSAEWPFSVQWRFRTGPEMQVLAPATTATIQGSVLTVRTRSPAPITLSAFSGNRSMAPTTVTPSGSGEDLTASVPLALRSGQWEVCAAQDPSGPYYSGSACTTMTGTLASRPGKVTGLRITRRDRSALIRWKPVADARRYRVVVRGSRGAPTRRTLRSPRVVIAVPRGRTLRISIAAVASDGTIGAPVQRTLRARRGAR